MRAAISRLAPKRPDFEPATGESAQGDRGGIIRVTKPATTTLMKQSPVHTTGKPATKPQYVRGWNQSMGI
jgi:hypothetical protein